MILIVESGATKTDWCAGPVPSLSPAGTEAPAEGSTLLSGGIPLLRVRTAGINLATMTEERVREVVLQADSELSQRLGCRPCFERIFFYAAGLVGTPEKADSILRRLYPEAVIEYASDLLDAARAVCGNEPGIAVILGTGSNSCAYDGEKIVKNIRPGGFILGDEGGGAALGKMFLSDYIKGLVPEPLASEFGESFKADYLTVVRNVYGGPSPAAYLGSFAPWILSKHTSSDYVRSIVEKNLRNFIERSLLQYDVKSLPAGIVGGFAFACSDIIREVAEPYGIRVLKILPTSIEALADYHLRNSVAAAAPHCG